MNRSISFWAFIATISLSLVGCDNGGGGGDGSAGATATVPADSYYVVADANGNTVSFYKNGTQLARVNSGSSSPTSVIVHPNKKFVYVGHGFVPAISAFKANRASSSGFDFVSTVSASAPVSYGAITPNGKFLYAVASNQRFLMSYSIDANTGALTQIAGSPIDLGAAVQLTGLDVTLDGNYLVLGDTNGQRLLSYGIDANSGALTFKSSRGVGGAVNGVRTNPGSGKVYFAVGVGVISDTTVGSDGSLSANSVSGVTFPNAALLRFNSDGTLIFAGGTSGEVNCYKVGATDVLTLASSVNGLGMPLSGLDYDSSAHIMGVVSPAANQGFSTYQVTNDGQMSLLQFYPSPAAEQATGVGLVSF